MNKPERSPANENPTIKGPNRLAWIRLAFCKRFFGKRSYVIAVGHEVYGKRNLMPCLIEFIRGLPIGTPIKFGVVRPRNSVSTDCAKVDYVVTIGFPASLWEGFESSLEGWDRVQKPHVFVSGEDGGPTEAKEVRIEDIWSKQDIPDPQQTDYEIDPEKLNRIFERHRRNNNVAPLIRRLVYAERQLDLLRESTKPLRESHAKLEGVVSRMLVRLEELENG